MCIRDRLYLSQDGGDSWELRKELGGWYFGFKQMIFEPADCLLYTSDAADERSSVDLGGRRIIKKKKNVVDGNC